MPVQTTKIYDRQDALRLVFFQSALRRLSLDEHIKLKLF